MMASAQKIDEVVKTVVEKEASVTLTLSVEEAQTLLLMCGHVYGSSAPRKHTASVYEALSNLGIRNGFIDKWALSAVISFEKA